MTQPHTLRKRRIMPSGGTSESDLLANSKYLQAKRLARIRQLREVEASSGRVRSDLTLAQSAMSVAEKLSNNAAFEADKISDLTDPHDLLSSGFSMDQLNSILRQKHVQQHCTGKWAFRTANDRVDAAWRTVVTQESATCARDPMLSLSQKLRTSESPLAATVVDAFSLTLDVVKDTLFWLGKLSHTARLARVNLIAGKGAEGGGEEDEDGDEGERCDSGGEGGGDESIVEISDQMKSVAIADLLIGAAVTFDDRLKKESHLMDSTATVRRQSLVRVDDDRPWVNSDLIIEQSRLAKEVAMTLSTVPGIRNRQGAPVRPPAWVAPSSATGQPADASSVQSLAFGFNDLHVFIALELARAISFDTCQTVRKVLRLASGNDRDADDDDEVTKLVEDRLNVLIPIPQYHATDAIRTTNTPIQLPLSNSGTHRRAMGVTSKQLSAEEIESIRSTRSILAGRRLSTSSLEVREAIQFRQNRTKTRITGDLFSYSTWANATRDVCLRRGYYHCSEDVLPLLDLDIGIFQTCTAQSIYRGDYESVKYEAGCAPLGVGDVAGQDDVDMSFLTTATDLENELLAMW